MNVHDLPQGANALGANADPLRNDPLLEALLYVCRHYGAARSALSLIDGLPYDGRLTPENALRALAQNGFVARMVERSMHDLYTGLFPVVLLRHEGRASVVLERLPVLDPKGEARFRVTACDATGAERVVSESELVQDYTGFCFLIKQEPKFEKRTDFVDAEP